MPWFELLVYALTPLGAAWVARRRGLGWLDPVLTCYAVGLLLANLPITIDPAATKTVAEVVVPLAIPLLLFKTDFIAWLRTSRSTVVGFVTAVISALVGLVAATLLFRGATEHLPYATGMLAGSWTGGSPNLVSVGAALEAPEDVLVLTNAADMFVGGIYLFALLTFARPLLAKWLVEPEDVEPMSVEVRAQVPLTRRIVDGALSLVVGILIVGVSVGLSMLVLGELSVAWVILGITTGGVAASFAGRVRALEMSYEVGNYLILVFCVAIGAMTDLGTLLDSGTTFLGFAAVALTITLVLHYVACRFTRIDVDTAIITSVATVMGPALVVPVAKRLDNRGAFVSGITSGLVGYALANYVGIAMAKLAAALM